MTQRLPGGDKDLDLTGMVALDHHGRVGLITGRATILTEEGQSLGFWKGVEIRGEGHWRWTAARPLVVCESLTEYVENTDDMLGLAGR